TGRLRRLEERLGVRASAAASPPPLQPARHRGAAVEEAPHPSPEAKPRLQVRLLGAFECSVDDRTVPPDAWGSRKARSLFKYLLLRRGRRVLADDLLEEFWPDLMDDGARHALRSTLHRLRRALEPDRPARAQSAFVQVANDTVGLQLGAETAVDLFEFED